MRSTVVLLFTALLLSGPLARASSPVVHAKNSRFSFSSIGVFFEFETRPPQLAIDTLEQEVESIMHPAGLSFGWRELGGSQSHGSFADLVVIKFKGTCSGLASQYPDPYALSNLAGAALASTKTSNGQVLHFTDVYCDEVRRYLSAEAAPLNEAGRDMLYGRALGRIVSHEMWHIFAGTGKHASSGVARAWHSRQELVQAVFLFEPKEEEMLREYAMRALVSKEANPEP
jgi:hypothetical protein